MHNNSNLGRKAPPAYRRMQLVTATIVALARYGLSQTTLANISKESGISGPLAVFHFGSKEKLFVKTLSYLITERRRNLERAIGQETSNPERRLSAVINADILLMCQSPEWFIAWSCLWSDAQTRADYLSQLPDEAQAITTIFEDCCRDLIKQEGYIIDAEIAAQILRNTIDGCWLELAICAKPFTGKDAHRTILACAAVLFPKHFANSVSSRRTPSRAVLENS